jgi:hypothetical protein
VLLETAHSFNPLLYRRKFSLPTAYTGTQVRLNSRWKKRVLLDDMLCGLYTVNDNMTVINSKVTPLPVCFYELIIQENINIIFPVLLNSCPRPFTTLQFYCKTQIM